MSQANCGQWCCRRALISLVLVIVALIGCRREPSFGLYGPKGEIQTGDSAQVGVQVKNPPAPPQKLRFRWRATRGRCEPQESGNLSSTYIAPPESGEDRVTVEVFHGSESIFLDEILVKVVERSTPEPQVASTPTGESPSASATPGPRSSHQSTPSTSRRSGTSGRPTTRTGVVREPTSEPRVAHSPAGESHSTSATPVPRSSPQSIRPTIRIAQVPPCDPKGGPDTSADIAGEVSGVDPSNVRVVIYALTDYWYVQPLIAAPFTEIKQDGRWGTWTHTGSEYAALLVRPSYAPPARIHALPEEGRDVLAVTRVKGGGC